MTPSGITLLDNNVLVDGVRLASREVLDFLRA